jgi:hypothetical protein
MDPNLSASELFLESPKEDAEVGGLDRELVGWLTEPFDEFDSEGVWYGFPLISNS